MSIEFIIGTIIGLIGISPIVYMGIKKLKKPSLQELMAQLFKQDITPNDQKIILREISKRLSKNFGKQLKEEYIKNFTLGEKDEKGVFEEMCKINNMEPYPELCRALLGSDEDEPDIRRRYHFYNLQGLMSQLVEQHITPNEQKKILRDINAGLLNVKILDRQFLSEKYIAEFSLKKRGPEVVFEDMCIQNNIVPTPVLCKALLNNEAHDLTKKIKQALLNDPLIAKEKIEIIDNQNEILKNKRQIVYMSKLLQDRYSNTCNKLISILDKHNVPHRFLEGTKDIWCRDFMPVQTTSGKLIQFRYEPSILKGYEYLQSDGQEVCKANNIRPADEVSNINLDGGNVLICDDRAIISDRVFVENPEYTDTKKLIAEIAQRLEAKEVIIIPAQKSDFTGHADGMVRFVDRNTILGNCRKEDFKNWVKEINKVVKEHGLNYLDVPFFWDFKDIKHRHHAIGIYVNYLEVNDLIVVPIFEVPGKEDIDALAIERFSEIFPNRKIETINYNEIGLEGGLLNCSTWTIDDETEG